MWKQCTCNWVVRRLSESCRAGQAGSCVVLAVSETVGLQSMTESGRGARVIDNSAAQLSSCPGP